MPLEIDPSLRSDHGTSLLKRLKHGQVELVTTHMVATGRAQEAHQAGTVATFAFWNGEEDEAIQGRVTAIVPGPPFRFTVRAEEAG